VWTEIQQWATFVRNSSHNNITDSLPISTQWAQVLSPNSMHTAPTMSPSGMHNCPPTPSATVTALPNVQTMPTMTASAPTLPFFLSPPGFQVPFFPTFPATPLNSPSPFGHTCFNADLHCESTAKTENSG
jgi:hypothetical protein